jgi:hypothetical protein
MAKCIETLKVCKAADERLDYGFNLTDEFAHRWKPNRPYEYGQVVRPADLPATGFEYVASGADSSGGVSNGESEPIWPKTLGGTVTDGSITWTAQPMSYDGLRERISDVYWIGMGDIVLADAVEQDLPALQEVRIWCSEGTLGETYDCVANITTASGAIYECRLEVTIV